MNKILRETKCQNTNVQVSKKKHNLEAKGKREGGGNWGIGRPRRNHFKVWKKRAKTNQWVNKPKQSWMLKSGSIKDEDYQIIKV